MSDQQEVTLEELGLGILNVPQELQDNMMWAGCTYKVLDPSTGRRDKAPRCVKTGRRLSVTSSDGWVTFLEARNSSYPHIGMRLTADDPYVVVDLDHTDKEELKQQAAKIYHAFPDTYAERSASGLGVHIIMKGPNEKGRRKDNKEVYSQDRFMICTGKKLKGRPSEITDGGEVLANLRASLTEITNSEKIVEANSEPEKETDEIIFKRMSTAKNSDEIARLFRYIPTKSDDWSKLDAQLAQHICFYTRNVDQALRLFKKSKLYRGDGSKSGYERIDKYEQDYLINMTFGRAWALESQRRDDEAAVLRAEVDKLSEKHRITVKEEVKKNQVDVEKLGRLSVETYQDWLSNEALPPMTDMTGLLGQISDYIYESAPLQVKTIANAGALGLVSGIAGRHYNINKSGLTMYIVLIANTGTGKENASAGAKRILGSVADNSMPRAREFDGPGHIPSGQGLLRNISEDTTIPSKTIYLSEFGHLLKTITDSDANSADVKTRQVLLDFYSKSAWGAVVNEATYADKSRNTSIIQSPNVCILGDTVPDGFFGAVKMQHINEGFLPRFTLIEHEGYRSNIQMNVDQSVPADLTALVTTLITQVYSLYDSHSMIDISLEDHDANLILADFEQYCNAHINSNDKAKELWNRAHLKALRLAGLFAVSENIFMPKVTEEHAKLAVEYVLRDMLSYAIRMRSGRFGAGDAERESIVCSYLCDYFSGKAEYLPSFKPYTSMGLMPINAIVNGVGDQPAFTDRKRTPTFEITSILTELVARGYLTEVRPQLMFEQFEVEAKFTSRAEKAYVKGPHFDMLYNQTIEQESKV